MGFVKSLLESKGHDVHMIDLNATVFAALEELAKYDIGALIVTDKKGKIVGIFSERDYARKVILKAREKGVIIRPLGDVVILMPPLCVTEKGLKEIMDVTYQSIKEVTE